MNKVMRGCYDKKQLTQEEIEQIGLELCNSKSAKRRSAAKKIGKNRLVELSESLMAAYLKERNDKRTWETQVEMIKALGKIGYLPALPILAEGGQLHGQNVCYQDGKIVEVGMEKQRARWPLSTLFSDKCTLLDDAWFVEGKRHCAVKQYRYSTGKLKVEVNFVNGVPDGLCYEYSETGTQTMQGAYKNGDGRNMALLF